MRLLPWARWFVRLMLFEWNPGFIKLKLQELVLSLGVNVRVPCMLQHWLRM